MAAKHDQYGLDSPQQLQLPRLRMVLYGFVAVFVALLVLTFILHYRGQGPAVMSPSNLQLTRNYAQLHDDEILAYSGMAFYSTNLQTGKRTVLYAGRKLPTIGTLKWVGNRGALMVFKDNFFGTPVNGFFSTAGTALNNTTKNYSWYLDFSSKQLSVISDLPLNNSNTYYDEAAKILYYTTETAVGGKQAVRVYSYALGNDPAKLVLNTNSINGVSGIAKCSASPYFCLVANKTASDGSNHVFAVDDQSKLHDEWSSTNKIVSAEYPNYYTSGDGVQPAILRDISKKQTYNLGFKIDQNIHFAFTTDSNFYMFDAQDIGTYQVGQLTGNTVKLKKHDLKLSSGTYGNGIIGIHGANRSGTILITDSKGGQFPFSPQTYTDLTKTVTAQAAESSVKDCNKTTDSAESYTASTATFQIRIVAQDGFANNIKQFAECMTSKHSDAMYGYNYSIVGISPKDFKVIAP